MLAFHNASEQPNSDVITANKRMIQRCANTLSCEHEISGPEAASYLIGYGDQ
jgi:hypothetical protein